MGNTKKKFDKVFAGCLLTTIISRFSGNRTFYKALYRIVESYSLILKGKSTGVPAYTAKLNQIVDEVKS